MEPAIKTEPDLPIDQSDVDLLPPVSTSFEVPALDTSHISLSSQFCLPNNSLLDNGRIDDASIDLKPPMLDVKPPEHQAAGIDVKPPELEPVKSEVKDEKPEVDDVCKQFLKDDDFRPNNSSPHLLFDSSSHTLPDTIINSTNTDESLFVDKEEDMIGANMMDAKYDESFVPLVPISTAELNLASITADIKHENKLASEKLIKNDLDAISFHDKALKTDTFEDLDSIDIMRLPVDLDDAGNMDLLDDIVVDMKPDLLQETHACFLSLVRDVFCSTPDHRTTLENLHNKITTWIANPITALNDWYGLVDSWLDAVPSAIQFLAGESPNQTGDFVPYVEFKANLNIYQWIGAGRDSDQHLKHLCEFWLSQRGELGGGMPQLIMESELSNSIHAQTMDENSLGAGGSLPPSRFPTNWIVRKATDSETALFRQQERKRFEYPHQAFTYRMNGYESVVGPVKGIYTHTPATAKARGHTMLIADRPHYVTILSLVRDATARLPNGEGTRAEICELLKMSQYICPTASESVLQTIVSGALDRMHADNDPCVRYASKRKIWIYLHRNRTESELERAHQESQNVAKPKKKPVRRTKVVKVDGVSPKECVMIDGMSSAEAIPTPAVSVTPIVATPKKKTLMRTHAPTAIVVISSGAPLTPTMSNLISASVKFSQPSILTTMNSPPIPALSTIQPSLLVNKPPPLINQINVAAVQQKAAAQPELVPIKQFLDGKIEQVELDAGIDATPIIISKSPTMQSQPKITGIILDQKQAMASKIIGKPRSVHVPARAAESNLSPTGEFWFFFH